MTDQPDFKVGDIVLERTDNGDLDSRTLGVVEVVFDNSLSVRPRHERYVRTFSDGTYHLSKSRAVLADARLVYYLWGLESKWKRFEDLGQYFGKKPMYFEETKK
jgi:hypothetical protein